MSGRPRHGGMAEWHGRRMGRRMAPGKRFQTMHMMMHDKTVACVLLECEAVPSNAKPFSSTHAWCTCMAEIHEAQAWLTHRFPGMIAGFSLS